MNNQDTQKTIRITRSLKTIQHTATSRKSLVGRPSKRFKHQFSQENNEPAEVTKTDKETQVNLDRIITEDDLINPDEPSENYWQKLAEKREIALQEVLEKNYRLREIIEDLKKDNALLKQMVSEANSFVEIVKEELAANINNDTGIDVNDVSSEGETPEETNEVSSNDN